MTSKKVGALKQRMKNFAMYRAKKKPQEVESFDIDDKIEILESKIKECKWDLDNTFPGNENIVNKIKSYKGQLRELREEKRCQEKN